MSDVCQFESAADYNFETRNRLFLWAQLGTPEATQAYATFRDISDAEFLATKAQCKAAAKAMLEKLFDPSIAEKAKRAIEGASSIKFTGIAAQKERVRVRPEIYDIPEGLLVKPKYDVPEGTFKTKTPTMREEFEAEQPEAKKESLWPWIAGIGALGVGTVVAGALIVGAMMFGSNNPKKTRKKKKGRRK